MNRLPHQSGQIAKINFVDLPQATPDQIIKIETESGNIYSLVVVDPANRTVAMTDRNGRVPPTLIQILGACTVDANIIDTRLLKGQRFLSSNFLGVGNVSTQIYDMWIVVAPEEAKSLVFAARKNSPSDAQLSQLYAMLQQNVVHEFQAEYVSRIQELIKQFESPRALQIILALLKGAQQHGRLLQALTRLEHLLCNNWSHQSPRYRGIPIARQDETVIKALFVEFRVEFPPNTLVVGRQ